MQPAVAGLCSPNCPPCEGISIATAVCTAQREVHGELVCLGKPHCCPGKMRSTEMLCSNSVVMLKLSLKFNVPESVVPAKAGTQRLESLQSHWVPAFAGTTSISGLWQAG